MRKYMLTLIIFIFFNCTIFGQWNAINSPTNIQISAVEFVTSDIGFVSGGYNGDIFKTVNGGVDWVAQNSGLSYTNIFSIDFTSPLNGYACSGNNSVGTIINTNDGGENWDLQFTFDTSHLIDILFINEDVGFCVGFDGVILKTINSGVEWVEVDSGTTQNLRSIYFVNDSTGFISGNNGVILKTIDGGSNWFSSPSNTNSILLDIYFIDENIGYTVGTNGTILKTTNGGVSWNSSVSGTNYIFQSVKFIDDNIGYAVGGYGIIANTTDGGITWNSENFGNFTSSYGWYDLAFINNTGYVVGYNGTIFKNTELLELIENSLDDVIKVYPNPTENLIHINFGLNHTNLLIKQYSLTGEEIQRKHLLPTKNATFDILGSTGIYIIDIITDNGKSTKLKILKK